MLSKNALLRICVALVTTSHCVSAVDPTVTIASGVLIGTASQVSNQASVTQLVSAFLGVPYAASPTRFAPPSPASSWATKTVKTLKPICYQQWGTDSAALRLRSEGENPWGPTPLPETEDCLNLNIFVPPNSNSGSAWPVMFYIYGGNLDIGGNSLKSYNGSSLAVNHKAVVVIPNYRTNFFGFSNSPDIPFGQQNSGLLDQRFALQWVQQNIKAFGGDPTKVTIFGQSAGGYAVKQLVVNPPSPLPFRAAIMQSSAHLPGNGPAAWTNVSTHFGCNPPPSGDTQTSCLRRVKATDLQAYISQYKVMTNPVMDGTYSGSTTLDKIVNKQIADIPVFIGTNYNELTIFAEALGLNDNSDLATSVAKLTGIDIGPIIKNLTGLYPSSLTGFQLICRIATDLTFTCPNALWASAVADNIKSGVWRYRYDAVFASTTYFPGAGAYHAAEIPEVWGTYPLKTQFGTASSDEIALSVYMQTAWTAFASNPSTGPQANVWPAFKAISSPQIGVLGGKNKTTGLNVQTSLWTDYPCPLYAPLLVAAGLAY